MTENSYLDKILELALTYDFTNELYYPKGVFPLYNKFPYIELQQDIIKMIEDYTLWNLIGIHQNGCGGLWTIEFGLSYDDADKLEVDRTTELMIDLTISRTLMCVFTTC